MARVDSGRVRIENHVPPSGDEAVVRSILDGLSGSPRRIASKFLYDDAGSRLFEEITRLEEYYPTRTEKALLESIAPSIGPGLGGADIIELGSGDCSKISILLSATPAALRRTIRYVPVDISLSALEQSAAILAARYPRLCIHGIAADFLNRLDMLPGGRRRLFCFLGSTLGNLDDRESAGFFDALSSAMRPADRCILGVDMVKTATTLEAAYNDSRGVTAAFNRNILHAVNRLTGCNFEPEAFDHVAFYNQSRSRIEMHLRARRDMIVSCTPWSYKIAIRRDETIHTENSRKFTARAIAEMAGRAGLRIERGVIDDQGWFSLAVLCPDPARRRPC
jgi:L-histidine N-alpha-methyltransferase